jgi:hypothetical protein
MAESGRPVEFRASKDVIFVLGAGVDKALGLPLLNTLFRDLNGFAHGVGKEINKAIRSHCKSLRFDLQTYSGDEAENLGQKLLGSHQHLLITIQLALDKHPDSANTALVAVKKLVNKLSTIADENELDETTVTVLSKLTGEISEGVGDTLLETDKITFRPKVRQAIKSLFSQVSAGIPNLTPQEQDAFAEVIAILSNFEELMGTLFAGYFTKNTSNQKKYFYLAWLLWAYIRHHEFAGRAYREHSFYKTLAAVGPGGGIITFNYTDFFYGDMRPSNGYFHGDSRALIRFHSREYIADSVQVRDATTLERMKHLIDELQIDWTTNPAEITLPGFVPPLAVKPIICVEYLERWYECGAAIKAAKTIVIIGYSFNVADEHFNDLIRKGTKVARLIVINPDIDAVATRVCKLLGYDKGHLVSSKIGVLECQSSGRLTFVKSKAEDITSSHLEHLLRG